MTRRRRALLLGGLAVVLGALAASDVAGREAALTRRLGPSVGVVVARKDLPRGTRLSPRLLAVRRMPARYAPASGYSSAADLSGLRAAVAIPAGTDLLPALLDDSSASPAADAVLRPGERVAEIVARGSAGLVGAGSHVDVLVTTESADGTGRTTLALQDAEVVAVSAAPESTDARRDGSGPRVALALRVTLRQAVRLAAAQNFARELRVLPRAPGDRARLPGGWSAGSGR
jgi:pilus assembly protein CpaB